METESIRLLAEKVYLEDMTQDDIDILNQSVLMCVSVHSDKYSAWPIIDPSLKRSGYLWGAEARGHGAKVISELMAWLRAPEFLGLYEVVLFSDGRAVCEVRDGKIFSIRANLHDLNMILECIEKNNIPRNLFYGEQSIVEKHCVVEYSGMKAVSRMLLSPMDLMLRASECDDEEVSNTRKRLKNILSDECRRMSAVLSAVAMDSEAWPYANRKLMESCILLMQETISVLKAMALDDSPGSANITRIRNAAELLFRELAQED